MLDANVHRQEFEESSFFTQKCVIRNWKSPVLATTFGLTWRYLRYFLVLGLMPNLQAATGLDIKKCISFDDVVISLIFH